MFLKNTPSIHPYKHDKSPYISPFFSRPKQCIEKLRAGWYEDGGDKAALPCDELVARAMKDADRRLKEVGGLTGSMATGVSVNLTNNGVHCAVRIAHCAVLRTENCESEGFEVDTLTLAPLSSAASICKGALWLEKRPNL